jgi:hypothetical protein
VDFQNILYDKQNGVATITFNRPQAMNAFTIEMNGEVQRALKDADDDKTVRVIVLTGSGRAFCAGQDLKGRTPEKKGSLGESLRERYNPIILRLRRTEKISIAAVNGVAAGAGCNLALATDLRFAAEEATFRAGLLARRARAGLRRQHRAAAARRLQQGDGALAPRRAARRARGAAHRPRVEVVPAGELAATRERRPKKSPRGRVASASSNARSTAR